MHNPLDMVVFAKVVELRSFSAAAHRLEMSRSVISKHVTRLERSLGVRLLNRTTRRLGLTEAGQAVLEHCARISREAEASELVASTFAREPRGLLRVSCPGAFGRMHIAPAIPRFLAQHGQVTVELVMTDRPVDLVREQFDVAIASDVIPGANLVVKRLAPISWVVCASHAYLDEHPAPRAPQDLARHNCIYFSSSITPGDLWRFRGPDGGESSIRVRGNFRVNNSEAVRDAALAGAGIALLPTFVLHGAARTEELRSLLSGYTPMGTFDTHILAHYLVGPLVAPKVRAFVDFISATFAVSMDGVGGESLVRSAERAETLPDA